MSRSARAGALGCDMSVLRFVFGGWNELQRLYPDTPMEIERTYSGSSLRFGHSLFGYYGRCLDVSFGSRGLRMSVRYLSSRHFLPPIVIGWSDIERCDLTRFGLVGEAIKLSIRGWPSPLIVGRFLGKYGDVCALLKQRWQIAQKCPL
jgi:hypothetical protein